MRYTQWAAALIALVLASGQSFATTIYRTERTCPVGGEKYQSFGIGSTSSFGMRLDLQRLGPQAHLPYIECPNGFVVTKDEADYTPDEIAKLTVVVASEVFQTARKIAPPALRVVLQQEALGSSDAEMRWALFRVAFESEEGNRELRLVFLERTETAHRAALAVLAKDSDEWWFAALRRADLLRQLGRFDDCIAVAEDLAKAAAGRTDILPAVAAQILEHARAHDAAPAEFRFPESPTAE
jgi:hypothetical protein